MTDVQDIWKNVLMRNHHERQRKRIEELIPQLAICGHQHYLSLHKYISDSPERFFAREVFLRFYHFIEERHRSASHILRDYLKEKANRLDSAMFFLTEINHYVWHDALEQLDEYEFIRFIDQKVHPAYLRLTEAAFYPMIHIAAFFSRKDRGKETEGLDLFCAVEELRQTDLSFLVSVYRHIVRNSIAHGGVQYLQKEIRYEDKKGNQERLSDTEVVRLFDDLLDVCNAMALGFKVFALAHLADGCVIPQQLLLEELQAETESPWWHIEGCIPCQLLDKKQLLIYARPKTRDYFKVQFYSFLSAVLAEQFAPGYDRYFLSLRSTRSLPGWGAFNGQRIRAAREKTPKSLLDYTGILENDLLFFVPRPRLPRFLGKIVSYWHSFTLHLPFVFANIRESQGIPQMTPRYASLHRNGALAVLNGSVVLESPQGEVDKELVKRSCRKIIHLTASKARMGCRFWDMARVLPLGYARVNLFLRDYRKRRLSSFGLGSDLICTVQFKRLSRIQAPDIYQSEIEIYTRYRIAWNRAWLDNRGG